MEKHASYKFYGLTSEIKNTDCLGDFDNDGWLDIIEHNYVNDYNFREAKFISIRTNQPILSEKKLFIKHSFKTLKDMDSVGGFLPFDIIDLNKSKLD
jgi:hypothetical protein